MIKFLFKGIIRDKSRSLLPIIVVALGVFLTVFMSGFLRGVFGDISDINAKFTTGHVKILTRAFAENESQMPNDLALMNVQELISQLIIDYPDMEWVERIHTGGLLDVPDENGETREQGQAIGTAVDLLSPTSNEPERMNVIKSIVKGSLPARQGEALISDDFAERFGVSVGDEVTLFGSTMNGSMMFKNFVVSGTLRFGNTILDRGAIFMDIRDAQLALDMEDAASEILGYFKDGVYDDLKAQQVEKSFNARYSLVDDEFSPQMSRLVEQEGLGDYLALAESAGAMMVFIFVIAMSIVLWNTGLLGGLRRYNEFGVRLALGEEKKHIYKTTVYEAIMIGIIGSVAGTGLGLAATYYMQSHGWDISGILKNVGMMLPSVYRAKVTPDLFYIGFFPGVIATVLGSALAGFAIYKRKTSQLFHELEV
ncbi:MAG TPA: FtsX-like permease family protein [Bacteroidales bacterium]|nr:FtsX-like permease family protein [Bacteroidales bacterium]